MNALPDFIRPGAMVRLHNGWRARIYAVANGVTPIHGAMESQGVWIGCQWREDLLWANGGKVVHEWAIAGPAQPDYFALWQVLPSWVRFLARESDGRISGFSSKPTIYQDCWIGTHPISIPEEFYPPTTGEPWEESLVERPSV